MAKQDNFTRINSPGRKIFLDKNGQYFRKRLSKQQEICYSKLNVNWNYYLHKNTRLNYERLIFHLSSSAFS